MNNTFKEFTDRVKDNLLEYFGDAYLVNVCEVKKNNGISLTGVSVGIKECNISPTIYLNTFYDRYKAGEVYAQLIQEIIRVAEHFQVHNSFDISFFEDYQKVNTNIYFRIINLEKNKALLEEVPYRKFLDMAIVYYYRMNKEDHEKLGDDHGDSTASILIHNTHMKMWEIDEETLYADATINSEMYMIPEIINMRDVIIRMMMTKCEEFDHDSREWSDLQKNISSMLNQDTENDYMFVMSNHEKQYGAATMLNKEVLREFAEKQHANLYILPSSVHEVILVTENEMVSGIELQDMVREVNETQVIPEERLTDSVYYFNRRTLDFSILG